MNRLARCLALFLFAVVGLAGCAHAPPDNPHDPLEPLNRQVYKFNHFADRYIMHPIAQTYVNVTPRLLRKGIHNFSDNLKYPITISNDLLQLKLRRTGADIARFVINSVFGVAGLLDMATPLGLKHHNEDLGQTLGYWGLGQGIYLVLPFIGPSTLRDGVGRVGDLFLSPVNYIDDRDTVWTLQGLYLLDGRAGLLGFEATLESAFDPYLFVRSAYLQHRRAEVYDGHPPKEDLFESMPDDNDNQ